MQKILLLISILMISHVACAIPKDWKYNHLGVPTTEHNPAELYDTKYKFYTWGYENSEFNIQMMRFDADAPFPAVLKKYPHVAFQVPDLQQAVQGRKILWGPIESKPGLFVAMIEDPATGMPVELLQTKLDKNGMIQLHKALIKKP